LLLALDTATATASVAVYDRQRAKLLSELTWQARRRHTQDLMLAVEQALVHAGAGVEQIAALAVTTGPGSFTGVRIGISAVKGLGLGLAQAPQVVGIPTLSVTAAPWLDAAATGASPATVCAYVQAGRGRYNWAFFDPGDLLRRPGREDHAAGAAAEFCAALATFAPHPVWLAGEADAGLEEQIASLDHVCLVDGVSALRRAGHLARLAALLLAAGSADDLASLQPLYLQNP